jgi:hypothetical protein
VSVFVRAFPRYCAKFVNDFFAGLDNSARWADEEIGPLGLICFGLTLGMLALLLKIGGS